MLTNDPLQQLNMSRIITAAHSTIVLLADAARPWLEDERRSTIVRRALSLMLAGIAVWLFVAT